MAKWITNKPNKVLKGLIFLSLCSKWSMIDHLIPGVSRTPKMVFLFSLSLLSFGVILCCLLLLMCLLAKALMPLSIWTCAEPNIPCLRSSWLRSCRWYGVPPRDGMNSAASAVTKTLLRGDRTPQHQTSQSRCLHQTEMLPNNQQKP